MSNTSSFFTFATNMNCKSLRIPYRQTNAFSPLALDYIDHHDLLKPFYLNSATIQGIHKQLVLKQEQSIDREALLQVLKEQYSAMDLGEAVQGNIEKLREKNCFTITTAHQPNLFTGPLYFIYKIMHAIKLAEHLQTSIEGYSFVPVYYMGSEDADFEELGHINLANEKKEWKTNQSGAFGKMKVDDGLISLLSTIEGQLSVLPQGKPLCEVLKTCYAKGKTIQQATLEFVHFLFKQYGLVVLIADHPLLKKQVITIFKDDLLAQKPSAIVGDTSKKLDEHYKVQAHPRDINLFYLGDGLRGRIEKTGDVYRVHQSTAVFSEQELLDTLENHPEKFSPNVILRGIFQETILPNVVFIGGSGELAYWLQLKDLFTTYEVPFPVLVLRNSFMLLESNAKDLVNKTGLQIEEVFEPLNELINELVKKQTTADLSLTPSLEQLSSIYHRIKKQVAEIDSTLMAHVESLESRSLHRLQELEKKMLRAEKRKYAAWQRQLEKMKAILFPGNGLQERYDNILYYYARYGESMMDNIYKHSLPLEQEFTVLEICE